MRKAPSEEGVERMGNEGETKSHLQKAAHHGRVFEGTGDKPMKEGLEAGKGTGVGRRLWSPGGLQARISEAGQIRMLTRSGMQAQERVAADRKGGLSE